MRKCNFEMMLCGFTKNEDSFLAHMTKLSIYGILLPRMFYKHEEYM